MTTSTKSIAHIWRDSDIASASHAYGVDDKQFSFPNGTLQVLASAFALQLNRKTPWDLQNLSPSWRTAAACAAKIYKRGVPVQHEIEPSKNDLSKVKVDIQFQSEKFSFETLPSSLREKKIFTIIDSKIDLPASARPQAEKIFSLQAEEQNKTLASVAKILDVFKKKPAAAIVVIGGGLTLDIGGFVAYLCKVPTYYFPSTLLAMVDAAIGGKTAVNDPVHGKNQIGAFYQPETVFICKPFLKTLPKRQWLAGAAECFKHLLLESKFDELDAFATSIADNDVDAIYSLLPSLIATKVQIVERDPLEQGERARLNLGHTIAHGLESALNYQISHGEGVLLGMATEVLMSQELGYLKEKHAEQCLKAFEKSGIGASEELRNILRTHKEDLFTLMLPFMQQDKKAIESKAGSLPCIILGKTTKDQNDVSQIPVDQVARSFQLALAKLTP